MQIKKMIILGLSVGTLGVLGSANVHAELITNGDSQTIDNSQGPNVTDANVAITGYLGKDNTDPGGPPPTNPDEWINVTLPTAAIFQSDGTTDHQTIISPSHTIQNNSGRPVQVQVVGFTGDVTNIDDLAVSSAGKTVDLIETGALSVAPTGILMQLNSPAVGTQTPFVDSKGTFEFAGTTNATWSLTHKPQQVKQTLTLGFTALEADGTPIAP